MKENTRRLIDYSLPAVFENVLQTSVGFIDSVLIAKISLVAVSAVSLVNGVMAVYQAVFIALAVAVATVVSNAAGARATKEVSENVRQIYRTVFGYWRHFINFILSFSSADFTGNGGKR